MANRKLGGGLAPKFPPLAFVPPNPDPFGAVALSPGGIAESPDGHSVYVTLGPDDWQWVAQFDVGARGVLALKSPAKVAAGPFPVDVAVSPDGNSVYVTNSADVGPGGASRSTPSGPVVRCRLRARRRWPPAPARSGSR
jgi:DNA-binding beta-propeller fold protein YncE